MIPPIVKQTPLKILTVISLLLFAAAPSWGADIRKGFIAAQNGDYVTALNEWRPLAEQGYANVQFNLGLTYDNGGDVPHDRDAAIKWYTLAAKQGHENAQYRLDAMH